MWRAKISNNFYVADTVSICKCKSGIKDECDGNVINSERIYLRTNWTCSEYLSDNKCKVKPTGRQTLIPTEHNGEANFKFKIADFSNSNAPECKLGRWNITITDENGKIFGNKTYSCTSSEKDISLPPNNNRTPCYMVNARLKSTRKKNIKT